MDSGGRPTRSLPPAAAPGASTAAVRGESETILESDPRMMGPPLSVGEDEKAAVTRGAPGAPPTPTLRSLLLSILGGMVNGPAAPDGS